MRYFNVLIIFSCMILSLEGLGQSIGFSYQAIALDRSRAEGFGRDSEGEILANTDINVRFFLTKDNEEGEEVYSETHATKTDVFGMFRLIVGRGESSGNTLSNLEWGLSPHFLHVELDIGNGFEYLGSEELMGAPYALNAQPQTLDLVANQLSISGGNAILLEDLDNTNELITSAVLNGLSLDITEADVMTSVDLSILIDDADSDPSNEIQDISTDGNAGNITLSEGSTLDINVDDADASATNELVTDFEVNGANLELTDAGGTIQVALDDIDDQDLSLSGNTLNISNGTGVSLAEYLDNTDTQELSTDGSSGEISLTDGGSIIINVDDADSDPINEIQDISTDGNAGNITLSEGSTLDINVDDADASTTNELVTNFEVNGANLELTDAGGAIQVALDDIDDQDLSLSGNTLNIANGTGVSLAGYLDNTDTQDLSTDGSAGDISLTDGGNISINVNDADASTTNELVTDFEVNGANLELTDAGGTTQVALDDIDDQDLSLSGNTLNIANGTGVSLAGYLDNTDTQDLSTDGSAGDISLTDGGNISINVNDADASTTNELVTDFEVNGANLELTDAGGTTQVALDDIDDQDLSLSGNTLNIANGTGVSLAGYLDNTDTQDLSTDGSAGDLSLTDGGNVTLNVNDADASTTNELVTDFEVNGTNLELTDAGGTTQVALDDIDDQDLSLTGNTLNIANGTGVSLSGYLDNTDTQDLSTDGSAGDISLTDGGNISINVNDADASTTNELVTDFEVNGANLELTDAGGAIQVALDDIDDQDLSLSGNTLNIANGTGVSLAGYLDNTDTQDLSTDGSAGDLSLTDGGNVTLNVNDADASTTNELVTDFEVNGANLELTDAGGAIQVALDDIDDQDLSLSGNTLNIANGTGVNLAGYLDNTDTQDLSTDGSAGDLSLTDGGNVTLNVNDADASTTNELVTDFSISSGNLRLIEAGTTRNVALSSISPFSTASNVTSNIGGAEASDDFVFGSSQLDDDGDTDHDYRMFFDKSKGAFRAGRATGAEWDDSNRGISSTAFGITTTASGSYSNAFGFFTTASGAYSNAFGNVNTASGHFSNAFGSYNSAPAYGETVIGFFGTSYTALAPASASNNDTDRLFTVGNGTSAGSANRHNALTLYKNGDFVTGSSTLDDSGDVDDDYRMFFDKSKGAFRAGRATGAEWDDSNRGTYSVALGYNTTASGLHSMVVGYNSMASGTYSYAFGNNNAATGGNSIAFGSGTIASATGANSFGGNTTASGNYSNALGLSVSALAFGETSIGFYGSTYSGATANSSGQNDIDRLLTVGNGTGTASTDRHNALTLYKNGDFVVGSSTLNESGDDDDEFRMFYDKSKGAFRAGWAETDQWDEANVGDLTAGFGKNTTASGTFSTAFGSNTTASGAVALAFGVYSIASGTVSSSFGNRSVASGGTSTAFGEYTNSESYVEAVFGSYNTDYSPGSTNTFQAGDRLLVLGNGTGLSARSDALIILKNGNGTLAGTLTQNSDRRLKQDISTIKGSLSSISNLRGVHFKWNEVKPHDMESIQTGFIAQEVEKLFPELVTENSEGYKSVNYIGVVPHLVEAIKELKLSHEEEMRSLESRLETLEKMMSALADSKVDGQTDSSE